MKNRPIASGIIAVASPIPLLIFTALWSWIWGFGIGMGLLQYENIPPWISIISSLPLLISPLMGVAGIIHGSIKIKEKLAWLGIILSTVCLIENFGLIYGILYLGSRF